MTTSQVLQEARRKIEGGWIRGVRVLPYASGEAAYCLVGAIEASTPVEAEQERAFWVLAAQLAPADDSCPLVSCIEFNDAPQRRQQQVMALIDAALVEVTK